MSEVELLISDEEIKHRITQVAHTLDTYYHGEEVTMVFVMKSALCLAADLIRSLRTSTLIESVTASSYGQRGTKRGDLKITGVERLDLENKHVLLVDDVYDSGETLRQVLAMLQEKKPKSLKSLVLLAKKINREHDVYPDYVLFEIANHFVVGYGLDYKERFRGLPGIYLMKASE
jgi:hypoxanthine phosphoribosyltransferase